MSERCCVSAPHSADRRYRAILWIALALNAAMLVVELAGSAVSGSAALAADAVDFAGDAGNYALSIAAIAAGGLWASRAALVKALAMAACGVGVIGFAAWRAAVGEAPQPLTMGAIGVLALAVNVGVGAMLYAYREGDANMRSVWLCTRNDVVGNLAVLIAAAGVSGTGTLWPDVAVALLMAGLGLWSAREVVARARAELQAHGRPGRRVNRRGGDAM
jgi:Co/Zn/Cd efflux system component